MKSLKTIFLEIHDYTFIHSQDQGGKTNKHFIGREKEIERLKLLLTKSESKSGTFLITGSKGMGKTSLVNQVFREIFAIPSGFPTLMRYVRLMAIVFCFSLFHDIVIFSSESNCFSAHNFWWFSLLLASIILNVFDNENFIKEPWHPVRNYFLRNHLFQSIWDFLKFNGRDRNDKNTRIILQDIFLVCFSVFVYKFLRWCFCNNTTTGEAFLSIYLILVLTTFFRKTIAHWDEHNYVLNKLHTIQKYWIYSTRFLLTLFYFIQILLLYLIIYVYKLKYVFIFLILILLPGVFFYFKKKFQKKEINFFKIGNFRTFLKNQFNYGSFASIKVNLNINNLTDKEVLTLIAKRTYQEYTAWRKSIYRPLPRIVWIFVYYLLIFMLSYQLFYSSPSQTQTEKWKSGAGLYDYLPSQAILKSNLPEKYLILESAHVGPELYISKINNILETDSSEIRIKPIEVYNAYNQKLILDSLVIRINNEINYIKNYNIINTEDLTKYKLSYLNELINIKDKIKKNTLNFPDKKSLIDNLTNLLSLPDGNNYLKTFLEMSITEIEKNLKASEFRLFVIRTDQYIQSMYQYIRKNLEIRKWTIYDFDFLKRDENTKHNIPAYINYYFILFLLLIIGIINTLAKHSNWYGFPSPSYVSRMLKNLIYHIDAQVSEDNSLNVPTAFGQGTPRHSLFSFIKRRSYPRMDARAIETELLHILETMDKIPGIINKPRLIYVFDELDKISNNDNLNIETNNHLKKEEIVIRLIGNLKYFFNSAKAKFIFIAGREMFETALSDVSDRDSYISSLFNDIIEIPSFYSDYSDGRPTDITSMTEQFVCKYLMTPKAHYKYNGNDTIKFKKYIEQEKAKINNVKYLETEQDQKDTINYILFVVSMFINFLTIRSNGAPKKLSSLFEKYIVNRNELIHHNDENSIKIHHKSSSLYLKFETRDQQRFTFTSNLFIPFLLEVGQYMKGASDKLLVNTVYMMDHIYKFHQTAFSWEQLEYMPEILNAHKSPQTREYLTKILKHLTKEHLKYQEGGLHSYKFDHLIASEIKYMTDISDFDAAAYNFSADEIHRIIKPYLSELSLIEKEIKSNSTFSSRFCNINILIGDLKYHSHEYRGAKESYETALNHMKQYGSIKNRQELLYQYTRTMLKLSLVLESMNDKQAIDVCNELLINIHSFQQLQLEEYGLQEFYLPIKEKALFIKDHGHEIEIEQAIKDENKLDFIIVIGKKINEVSNKEIEGGLLSTKTKEITKFGKSSYKYMSYFYCTKHIFKTIGLSRLPFETNVISTRLKSFTLEADLLFSEAIINRLFLKEKFDENGITIIDLEFAESQFDLQFSYANVDDKKRRLMKSKFLNKIGDILYYKNGWLHTDKEVDVNVFSLNDINDKSIFLKPCSAYLYYILGIKEILNSPSKNLELEFEILKLISDGNFYQIEFAEEITDYVVDLAGTILSFTNKDEKLNNLLFFGYIFDNTINLCTCKFKDGFYYYKNMSNIDQAFLFYFHAHKVYKLLNNTNKSFEQIQKIFYLLDTYCNCNELSNIEKKFINSILSEFDLNINNYSLMNYKYSVIKDINYHSNILTECQSLIKRIQQKIDVGNIEAISEIKLLQNNYLKILFKYNEVIKNENSPDLDRINTVIELMEILESLDLYQNNYITSYPSNKAAIAFKIGSLLYLQNIERLLNSILKKYSHTQKYGGTERTTNFIKSIDPKYYYNLAYDSNYKALEMHNSGTENKEFFRNNFYLEDDLNDSQVHFNFALERYKINVGFIEKKQIDLKDKLK